MLVTLVVAAAAVLQYAAVLFAIRVLRITGRSLAWQAIIAVAILMALRRSIVFVHLLDGQYEADPIGEVDSLAASGLMLIAMVLAGPFIKSLHESREQLRHRVRELNGLYGLSTVVEAKGDDERAVLQEVPGLLLSCLPDHERAAVRIQVGDTCFATAGFSEQTTNFQCEVGTPRRPFGVIEISGFGHNGSPTPAVLSEEARHLLAAFAERLGRAIERLRAQEEKAALQEQLHRAQKMEAVGQLSAGVAHDVNNLVTVVLGHARMPADAAPELAARLKAIAGAAEDMREITRSLLKFAGRTAADKRVIDLCETARDAGRLLSHTLPASHRLLIEAPETSVWIRANRAQLQQVLLNLGLNARDALPDGGTIRVCVRPAVRGAEAAGQQRSADAVLEVSDTGVGMSPEVVARIFDPFFTTKQRGKGTGLGLSVVHGIIREHDGSIEVRSRENEGTTFTIRLPAAGEAQTAEATAADAVPFGHGEFIVLAEDHQLVREVMVSALRELKYEVYAVADGAELLEACRRYKGSIALFIIDADLPQRNGLACLAQLREAGCVVPAIVISARPDSVPEEIDASTAVLPKPFDMQALGRVVHEMLGVEQAEELPA